MILQLVTGRKSEVPRKRKMLSAFVVWEMEGPGEKGLSSASNGENVPLALEAWNS